MKKKTKKLVLAKETIAALVDADVQKATGGGQLTDDPCPSAWYYDHFSACLC
jgi:hypothetical protein